jgi:quinol-cytochrome oxidoreductase complex cytochrome b subunit
MLIMVPIMFIVTIAMTFLFMAQIYAGETDISHAIANDFAMVHEWRSGQVKLEGLRDGEFDILPGYPFEPFYEYYTEVHETDAFIAVVTWPIASLGTVVLPADDNRDLLANLEGRLNQGFYSGNFKSYGIDAGGRVTSFDLVGMDEQPIDGSPVLLKIFSKEP